MGETLKPSRLEVAQAFVMHLGHRDFDTRHEPALLHRDLQGSAIAASNRALLVARPWQGTSSSSPSGQAGLLNL